MSRLRSGFLLVFLVAGAAVSAPGVALKPSPAPFPAPLRTLRVNLSAAQQLLLSPNRQPSRATRSATAREIFRSPICCPANTPSGCRCRVSAPSNARTSCLARASASPSATFNWKSVALAKRSSSKRAAPTSTPRKRSTAASSPRRNRTGPGARARRHLDHAAAAWRAYENTVDSLGMSFGTAVPNVGGARRDWSNVIVDGVVGNEVGNSGLMAQQINLDAIAEVRVLLNSYRAEDGRAGGGQVQIVSKSGGIELSRQRLSLPAQRGAQREQLVQQPVEHQASRATASTPSAPTLAARCPA